MLHSLVGELVDWVYETMDDYTMVTSMSKYVMSQGDLTFEGAGYEPSSVPEDSGDQTQLAKETYDLAGTAC